MFFAAAHNFLNWFYAVDEDESSKPYELTDSDSNEILKELFVNSNVTVSTERLILEVLLKERKLHYRELVKPIVEVYSLFHLIHENIY